MTHDARSALRAAGLTPKKSFGQNFLVAPDVTRRIAAAAVPEGEAGTTVVEVGAGTGALTVELALRAARVIAIERDRDLVPLLRATVPSHVEVVEADAKTFECPSGVVLVGNLPYQLTGPLLERATAMASRLVRVVFMVQREVAERLVASPGTKAYGALTVFVRAAFDVERVMRVGAGAFFPRPAVDSAVVLLTPRAERIEESDRFRSLVHAAFEQRRKTLRNAWRAIAPPPVVAAAAETAGISLDARGETLSVAEFAAMARALG